MTKVSKIIVVLLSFAMKDSCANGFRELNYPSLETSRMEEAKKVAQDFEAVMIGKMMQQMTVGSNQESLLGDNASIKLYKEMLADEYGKIAAEKGGIGLAKSIIKSMKRSDDTLREEVEK